MSLKDLLETAGSIFIQSESIKAGIPVNGNLPSDYPNGRAGVDSDGSSIVDKRIIAGVSNGTLLAGAAVVLVALTAVYLVASD